MQFLSHATWYGKLSGGFSGEINAVWKVPDIQKKTAKLT
jgi:hypothetical protein